MSVTNTPSDATNNYGLNLLVIEDDDEDSFEIISALIQDARVKSIHRSVDGQDAIGWLSNTTVKTDLIICDINMPRMNGLEFLRQVRTEIRTPPPVVILTNSNRGEDFHRSLMRDAATYIHKPSTHSGLVDVLNVMLCTFQLRQKMPPLLAA